MRGPVALHQALVDAFELETVTLELAKGEVEVEALAIWFRQRLRVE
jgi:hypothetical protein